MHCVVSPPGSVPQSPSEERHRAFVPPSIPNLLHPNMYGRDAFRAVHFSTPVTPAPRTTVREWETMVLFAVNLSELDIAVNMSNLMGNVMWV